jgi:hypothetical protein
VRLRGVVPSHDALLGYCTNVHAGATLDRTRAALAEHALAVKARVSPDLPMGLGLWLSNRAVAELSRADAVEQLSAWLGERGLFAFTLNGFPYGDFHEPVVKLRVYEPDWTRRERLDYTIALARILAGLLGERSEGSISTLPVGWAARLLSRDAQALAAQHQLLAADALARIEAETGKWIHLDLEPEPGCLLETSDDVVAWFERWLLPQGDERRIRRHLRICHDVCHHAVMFERQEHVLRRYRERGLAVGKVQLSSALRVPFEQMEPAEVERARSALQPFAEERYLHQTVVREPGSGRCRFFADLPAALEELGPRRPGGEWRVHYHVPLYLERIGALTTTAAETREVLALAARLCDVRHFEAETYAWSVLPEPLRQPDLATGIARELEWVQGQSC